MQALSQGSNTPVQSHYWGRHDCYQLLLSHLDTIDSEHKMPRPFYSTEIEAIKLSKKYGRVLDALRWNFEVQMISLNAIRAGDIILQLDENYTRCHIAIDNRRYRSSHESLIRETNREGLYTGSIAIHSKIDGRNILIVRCSKRDKSD